MDIKISHVDKVHVTILDDPSLRAQLSKYFILDGFNGHLPQICLITRPAGHVLSLNIRPEYLDEPRLEELTRFVREHCSLAAPTYEPEPVSMTGTPQQIEQRVKRRGIFGVWGAAMMLRHLALAKDPPRLKDVAIYAKGETHLHGVMRLKLLVPVFLDVLDASEAADAKRRGVPISLITDEIRNKILTRHASHGFTYMLLPVTHDDPALQSLAPKT